MRIVVIGLGTQGRKRVRVAGDDVVATVDPSVDDALFGDIRDVPVDHYDAALVCTPDALKVPIIQYLLARGKHVLVEKPLLLTPVEHADLETLRAAFDGACYTAYNHRFEPHLVRVRELIREQRIGRIYTLSMFYGNGTARDVRQSPWRDQGDGVVSDLASHQFDLLDFWFGRDAQPLALQPEILWWERFENAACDAYAMRVQADGAIAQLEGTLLSWRNTFRLDIVGERGSIHVDGLCKWGPSTLTIRDRILPSGRPPEQEFVLEQADPTWLAEYQHFAEICNVGSGAGLARDLAISEALRLVGRQIGTPA